MNPSGEIFNNLVDRELGVSCPKCGNDDLCIVPNDDVTPRKDNTIESFVKFWERYITDPVLIKKELQMHCHNCSGKNH